jgi:hypothetical protein
MPAYEGYVASIKEAGKAEVIVQPETSGIVGAPEAGQKVCHCASSSSQVTVDALNPVRAAVGDRVAVRVDSTLLLRNAAALIGMPVFALVLGWAISSSIPEGELVGVPFRFLCLLLALPVGIAGGVLLYRRWSRTSLPIIARVVRTREEMAAGTLVSPKDVQGSPLDCERCKRAG